MILTHHFLKYLLVKLSQHNIVFSGHLSLMDAHHLLQTHSQHHLYSEIQQNIPVAVLLHNKT